MTKSEKLISAVKLRLYFDCKINGFGKLTKSVMFFCYMLYKLVNNLLKSGYNSVIIKRHSIPYAKKITQGMCLI